MKRIIFSLFKTESKTGRRLPLILITAAITCMTIFASMNIVGLLSASMEGDIRASKVGNSDFVLYEKNHDIYKKPELGKDNPSLDVFQTEGTLRRKGREQKCTLFGAELKEYKEVFGKLGGENGKAVSAFVPNGIIVNERAAKELTLEKGDTVSLEAGGVKREYKVMLADSENRFLNSADGMVLISPKELKGMLGAEEACVTAQYLYNSSSEKEDIQKKINNDTIIVENAIDENVMRSGLKSYYGILAILFGVILVSCYDILESANRIFLIERSGLIGALRSLGTTKKQIKSVFGLYVLLLALFGSGAGIILGELCLAGYNRYFLGAEKLTQSLAEFLATGGITFLLCGIVMLYSVFSPLKQILKKSDKDILLGANTVYVDNTLRPLHLISAICLGVLITVSGLYSRNSAAFWGIALAAAFPAVLNTIKFLYWGMNRLLGTKPRKGLFLIAVKNILNNFFVRKTISTTISVSLFILLICTLSFSTVNGLSSFYNEYKADAYVRAETYFSKEDRETIRSLDAVEKYLFYSASDLTCYNQKKIQVVSVDNPRLLEQEFINLRIKWRKGFDAAAFSSGYYIITTKILAERYHLKPGDKVECSDGKTTQKYQIVGIADTMLELGDVSYISDYQIEFPAYQDYNGVYLKAAEDKDIENELRAGLKGENYKYTSVEEMIEKDQKNSSNLFTLFYVFAMFTAFTNLTGIYSNYRLSYMFRKKEMAALYSYGYENKTLIKMVVYEILCSAFFSFWFSVGAAILLIHILEKLMKAVEIPIPLAMSKEILLLSAGIIVCIAVVNLWLAVRYVSRSKQQLVVNLKS